MAKKRTKGSEPYVENYPDLHAWLRKIGARCQWQIESPNGAMMVEGWICNARMFVTEVHSGGTGWQVYTGEPTGSISIGDTLSDANARLGVKP